MVCGKEALNADSDIADGRAEVRRAELGVRAERRWQQLPHRLTVTLCSAFSPARHSTAVASAAALASCAASSQVRSVHLSQPTLLTSMGKAARPKRRDKHSAASSGSTQLGSFTAVSSAKRRQQAPSSASSSPHHVDLLGAAFLEWLLPHHRRSTDQHALWSAFMSDWSAVPESELPVTLTRPLTLHAYLKRYRNAANVAAARADVRAARERMQREAGMQPHQSLLAFYLQPDDGDNQGGTVRRKRRQRDAAPEAKETELPTDELSAASQDAAPAKRGRRGDRQQAGGSEGARGSVAAEPRSAPTLGICRSSTVWDALLDAG